MFFQSRLAASKEIHHHPHNHNMCKKLPLGRLLISILFPEICNSRSYHSTHIGSNKESSIIQHMYYEFLLWRQCSIHVDDKLCHWYVTASEDRVALRSYDVKPWRYHINNWPWQHWEIEAWERILYQEMNKPLIAFTILYLIYKLQHKPTKCVVRWMR